MGALPSQRKNPFEAKGLVPGVPLRMEVSVGNAVETLSTRIDDVDDEVLSVLVPMLRLRTRPLHTGAFVRATYVASNRRWRFVTEAMGLSPDGNVQHLALPVEIESSDRRTAFRLGTALRPDTVYRVVIESAGDADPNGNRIDATIVDLSEGGVCLSSRQDATVGEWIEMVVSLPSIGEVSTRMKVTGIEPPRSGQRNHRIHCQFAEITRGDRDKIARFLMRRQIEMRQRGQL
jgi:c-di-GMP-binding flagellar brake protein YcgR